MAVTPGDKGHGGRFSVPHYSENDNYFYVGCVL